MGTIKGLLDLRMLSRAQVHLTKYILVKPIVHSQDPHTIPQKELSIGVSLTIYSWTSIKRLPIKRPPFIK